MTEEELSVFLNMLENDCKYPDFSILMKVLLYTGMRSGEALGMQWSDIDFLTLHCLRHSNATLHLNSGVDLKIVSEHLGHSDVSVTASVYADVLDSSRRKTADILVFKLKQA